MSRSGTKWLVKNLNHHEDIVAFGETLFWGRGYIQPSAQGNYTPQQLTKVVSRLASMRPSPRGNSAGCLKKETVEGWSEIINSSFSELTGKHRSPAELFKQLLKAVSAAEGKRVAVEKTPHHINWINRIIEALPNAKFVATYRDPYGFMLSYKHQGSQRNKRIREVFRRQYHPLVAAIVWRGYMRSLLQAKDRYPDSMLIIPFVDINNDPKEVLRKVCVFFDVEPAIQKPLLKENSSFVTSFRPTLGSDDVFWMNLIAGKEIERAGFVRQPAAPKISVIILSILKIPMWLAANLSRWKNRLTYLWFWLSH